MKLLNRYLTRIKINDSRRAWWKVADKLEALHAIVAKTTPNSHGRILWRIDDEYENPVLYIMSDVIPDATAIVESYGWPKLPYEDQVRTVDMSKLFTTMQQGDRFGFRITVNPVKRDPDTGKMYSLVGENAKAFMVDKLKKSGFDVQEIVQRNESHSVLKKSGHRSVEKFTTYDGVLSIDDPVKAVNALVSGIGKMKAYGAGLLTLSRR